MKIELVHSEMEAALTAYVINQGFDVSGKAVNVHMVAGRGTNGFTANISIVPPEQAEKQAAPAEVDDREDPSLGDTTAAVEPDDQTSLFP